jgi:uncharacterized protein with von Willebrand factor type A (vWA) domain
MQRALEEFLLALRGGGLQPGLSECIDAYTAVRILGVGDRDALREALGACLAKSEAAREVFDEVFERYFAFEIFSAPQAAGATEADENVRPSPPASETCISEGAEADALLRIIETHDRAALARRLRQAEQQVGIVDAWLPTQRGLYTRRMLDAMGQEHLIVAEHALAATGMAEAGAAGRTQRVRWAGEGLLVGGATTSRAAWCSTARRPPRNCATNR